MPELPEVETVRRGLAEILKDRPRIEDIEIRRADLRQRVPAKKIKMAVGEQILGVRRRAKYLLFDLEQTTLINHLGMTGSWRLAPIGDEQRHDHICIHLSGGARLVFRDPRRFGLLTCVPKGNESQYSGFEALGPEPLSADFSAAAMFTRSRGRKVPVKVFIMDQQVVVGVGNIYASEALFRAGLNPLRRAEQISFAEWQKLVVAIQAVLSEAIAHGGTTLRDFRQAGGSEGYFRTELKVYDRGGEACRACEGPVRQQRLGGRSTFYCPICQPRQPRRGPQ